MQRFIRFSLSALLFLIALNAFGGGIYALTGAKEIPLEWLQGSPFKNYFIPGLFLFLIVGGCCMVSSILIYKNRKYARLSAWICSLLLMAWIAIQIYFIGYVSWLQPAVFISGIAVLLLSFNLKK